MIEQMEQRKHHKCIKKEWIETNRKAANTIAQAKQNETRDRRLK